MAPAPLLPPPDRLDRLVTMLDAATSDDSWHQPHRLVSLENDPEWPGRTTFGLRTLAPGEHPLDHLLGFVAPKAWTGMGVVCFGWAAPAEDADLGRGTATARPSAHPDRRRVRVITLIDRRGREQATASLDDGTVIDEPGSGTVTDALRRCLRLATPQPPGAVAEVFAAQWLLAIARSPRSVTTDWRQVALLHPALQLLEGSRFGPRADELVGCGRTLHQTLPWEQLRQRTAAGKVDGVGIPADLAEWMDEGMFARWVLAGLPLLPSLLQECADVVDAKMLRRVRHTLRAWDLDPPLPHPQRRAG